jgi:hypothetical protein
VKKMEYEEYRNTGNARNTREQEEDGELVA